ncbi:MAG: ribonuclease III family protein [candidate division NC10 bacterium]|nr:ribonuclease III family protein [candidate division NC10 bacterium]
METPGTPPSDLDAVRETVQLSLGYRFRDPALLDGALRILFPPLTPEAAAKRQRLEFLGDAAWDCAAAWVACTLWPEASAGDLTRFRSSWTSAEGLARLARVLGLPGPDNPSPNGPSERALAEMLEAILGAMMLDGGFETIRDLAGRVIVADGSPQKPPPLDAKSHLQMLAQASRVRLPSYRLLERWGAPHQPMFRVEATFYAPSGEIRASAERPNRQAAEQEAARLILAELEAASDSTGTD